MSARSDRRSRWGAIALGLTVALAGCGALPARPEPAQEPFICQAAPEPPPPEPLAWPAFDLPAGKLEVRCRPATDETRQHETDTVAEPGGCSRDAWRGAWRAHVRRSERTPVRCTVVAGNARLGALALALAAAADLDLSVDPRLVDRPVAMRLKEVRIDQLLTELSRAYRVHVRAGANGRLALLSDQGAVEAEEAERSQRMAKMTLEPVSTRLIPLPDWMPESQLAGAFCRLMASGRGSAVVAGPHLLVTDLRDRLDLFERLVGSLDKAGAVSCCAALDKEIFTCTDGAALPLRDAAGGPPFGCSSERFSPRPVEPVPVTTGPIGELEVACDPRPGDQPDERTFLRNVTCRLSADRVPLGSLALALGEALDVGVVVDGRLVGVRITLRAHGPLEEIPLQGAGVRIGLAWRQQTLRFSDTDLDVHRLSDCRHGSQAPLHVRAVLLPRGYPPVQVAEAACHFGLGPDASLAWVGGLLLVKDSQEGQTRIEALVKALDAELTAPAGREKE